MAQKTTCTSKIQSFIFLKFTTHTTKSVLEKFRRSKIIVDMILYIRFQANPLLRLESQQENQVKVNAFMLPDGEVDQNFQKGG